MRRAEFIGSVGMLGALGTLAGGPWKDALAAGFPDHVITAEETSWEVRPGLVVRTKSYGGVVPAPLLRLREGSRVTVEVRNRTSLPQSISWHGLVVPDWVDGLATPDVPPRGTRTYTFTATPAGTRMYHSVHGGGMFSGMVGPLIIDAKDEPGDYDREEIVVLHEFGPTIPKEGSMMDERPPGSPTLSAPAMAMGAGMDSMMAEMTGHGPGETSERNAAANMLMYDARYASYAVNGKALGAGEPIRVRRGERVRLRILNASATLTHRLALPGHRFRVTHLDGNPVPVQRTLDALELGPGERVDAIVDMDTPGIWVLGSTVEQARRLGLGIVVAYDGERGDPVWRDNAREPFRYQDFGRQAAPQQVDGTYDLILRKSPLEPNAWSINGQRYPHTMTVYVREGRTFLLRFSNLSMMEHPMHILGNDFELAMVDGKTTSGIRKDVVVVRPMMGRADIIFHANNPYGGRFLLMCHNWQHMEGGMASVLAYI